MPMPAQMRTPTPAPMPVAMAGGGGSQGSLRVNSRPWSQVFVDGRMVGNTPQLNLPLPSGHHKIKLVNPQLGMSKGFAVDIRAGKVATKIVDLE
jgi:serine/threonine-protein kinase